MEVESSRFVIPSSFNNHPEIHTNNEIGFFPESFRIRRKGTIAEAMGVAVSSGMRDVDILNRRETFGMPGNRIGLPLFGLD